MIPASGQTITAGRAAAPWPGEAHLARLRQLTLTGTSRAPRWSGDGTRLLVTGSRPGDAHERIYQLDLRTGEELAVSPAGMRVAGASFLHGDRGVVFAAATAAPGASDGAFDLFVLRDGTVTRITTTPGIDAFPDVCPVTGRLVLLSAREGEPELFGLEPDGTDGVRLTHRQGAERAPRWSPVGTHVVFVAGGAAGHGAAAVTIARDGSDERTIAGGVLPGSLVAFGPAGDTVVHAGAEGDLWLQPIGGGAAQRLTHAPAPDSDPAFSPDGRFLAFTSERSGTGPQVWVAAWRAR